MFPTFRRASSRIVPLLLCAAAAAQGDGAPTAAQKLADKLASPFLQVAPWTTDWDAARANAADAGRLILGYFTTANY
jgi:hypothetical protein